VFTIVEVIFPFLRASLLRKTHLSTPTETF
jgi:hypothetical protein